MSAESEKHETDHTCKIRVSHVCLQCMKTYSRKRRQLHSYLCRVVLSTTCVSTSHRHSFPCLSSGYAFGASARERSAHCFYLSTTTACEPTRSVIMRTECKRAHVIMYVTVTQGTSITQLNAWCNRGFAPSQALPPVASAVVETDSVSGLQ